MIIFLQETHSVADCEMQWKAEWAGDVLFAHGTSRVRGVCVLMPKGMLQLVSNINCDQCGRIINFDIQIDKRNVSMCNIYVPNNDNPAMAERSEHKIFIGDFNLVIDPSVDRIGSCSTKEKSLTLLSEFMSECYLCDIWRVKNPDIRRYSWYKCKPTLLASWIDFAVMSKGMIGECKNVCYMTGLQTDHLAFFMVLKFVENERGPGYWKLNTQLLRDKQYVSMMNELISNVLIESKAMLPKDKWEYLKFCIREESREYSKSKAAEIDLIIVQLSEYVAEMEESLESCDLELLQKTKYDLNDFAAQKAQACIFRAKSRYTELGERSTKYFFNLEKSRFNAKTCTALYEGDSEGNKLLMVTDTKGILRLQEKFYHSLYTSNSQVENTWINNVGRKVPEFLRTEQNRQFTITDLALATKQLQNEKTCGNDRIPVDFYKVFWSKLKTPYFELIKEVYSSGLLHKSALLGVMNIIPNQGKDTHFLKNLRPITLLNSDYKIIEKALANKMEKAMDYVIQEDQRGFLRKRRISVNIRMIYELTKHMNENNMSAFILSLDFEKCFDKIEFHAIINALQFFGFADCLINWTRTLYSEFKANTQNNGHFSNRFSINRGIHQGGPNSSFYFLICAEAMAILLRENQQIKGIPVKEMINILGQFADDADIYSLFEKSSINAIINTLETFRKMSGFTLNYQKTTIFRIGSLKKSDATLITQRTVAWTNEPINVPGVDITHDDPGKRNFSPLTDKVKGILTKWSARKLSLFAKVLIVNSLVTSLFVYKMTVLPAPPDHILKGVKSEIVKFLWNGSKPKISYEMMVASKESGGAGLCDLSIKDMALKATWVQILKNEPKLQNIVYSNMNIEIGQLFWSCKLQEKDIRELGFDPFWTQVCTAWFLLKSYLCSDRANKEIIWYNSEIRVRDKPVMWMDVYQRGLIYVHQLYENKRIISAKEAHDKYGLDIMRLNSFLSATPVPIMKNALNFQGDVNIGTDWYEVLTSKANLAKFAYDYFSSNMIKASLKRTNGKRN